MPWWSCFDNAITPAAAPYTGPLTDASRWLFQYGPGMPGSPELAAPGFKFALPTLPASVHYLVAQISRPVAQTVKASFTFELSADAVLTAHMPNGSNPDDGVPGVRLYFQRRGDDMSGAGEYEFYRWWSVDRVEIKPGSFELAAGLEDPAKWLSVYGKTGNLSPDQFREAAADCLVVGMTFGGWFAGHGVALTAGQGSCAVSAFTA